MSEEQWEEQTYDKAGYWLGLRQHHQDLQCPLWVLNSKYVVQRSGRSERELQSSPSCAAEVGVQEVSLKCGDKPHPGNIAASEYCKTCLGHMPVVLLMVRETQTSPSVSNSCNLVEMVPELIPARQIDVLRSLLLLQDLIYAVPKASICI